MMIIIFTIIIIISEFLKSVNNDKHRYQQLSSNCINIMGLTVVGMSILNQMIHFNVLHHN